MTRCARGAILAMLLSRVALAGEAKPFLHSLFHDHMVIQRGVAAPVWGWTTPGAKVTAEMAGKSAIATADKDGRWEAKLGPFEAGGPHALKIAGPQSVTISDVLVGEVWVCGGQSNMQFNLSTIHDDGKAIREADEPSIRFLCLFAQNSDLGSETPLDDLSATKGRWETCTPASAGRCSATAFFFGRELQRHLKVPVGLVVSALNGSPIEAWISRDALMTLPVYSKGGEFSPDWDPFKTPVPNWNVPCARYNAQIHPLAPFAIKGFIFYQGETNAMWGRGRRYRELLPLMIRTWRQCWGGEPLPFVVIQLVNTFGAQDPSKPFPRRCTWAEVQEAQLMARKMEKVDTAVIVDLGDGDIHPRNKPAIGARAARVARKIAYGEDLVPTGPAYSRMEIEDSAIRLHLDCVGTGLVASDGQPLRFFNIAGDDMDFKVAHAAIDGSTVVVSCPEVAKPVAVRYAWASNPKGVNFFNKEGLPASPFRTDDWNPDSMPKAAFAFHASGKDAPVAVVFDPGASADPENNLVTFRWDFGDGSTATGARATHIYKKGGDYTVKLTVTDGDGLSDTATAVIEVGAATPAPKPPMALLGTPPQGGTVPVTARFDASGSVDPDGKIASWAWDFGDGAKGEGATVSHTFAKPGTYAVKLTLTDDQGLTATATATLVTIGPGTGAGTILCERWKGIPGTSVADLKKHPHFAEKGGLQQAARRMRHSAQGLVASPPDDTTMLRTFDIPENWADSYGTRVRGFLHPPATGDYTFCIASDDSSEFLLSTDESPATAKGVCRMNGSTGRHHWTDAKDRKSEPIRLEAGKRYYVEALHKEATGGDHLSVGWEGPGIALAVIEGQYLSAPDKR